MITKYELLKDLSLIGIFSFFWPGSFYSDIKGTPMRGDLFSTLEKSDQASLDSTAYRLRDDTAFFSEIRVEYKF